MSAIIFKSEFDLSRYPKLFKDKKSKKSNMKTKEQVQEHLMSNAYPKDVINKIMGYIVAKGVKGSDEKVFHKTKTNGAWHTFDDFVEWFENEDIDLVADLDRRIREDLSKITQVAAYWITLPLFYVEFPDKNKSYGKQGESNSKKKKIALDFDITDMLIIEATLKGYDKKEFIPFSPDKIFSMDWEYLDEFDSLYYKGQCCYKRGKWAEFKKDKVELIENKFYHITMTDDAETIIQYKLSNNYKIVSGYCFSPNDDEDKLGIEGIYFLDFIKEFRFATPEEQQTLISAVEKEYNKTWNGKDWIDCVEYLDEKYETYYDKNGSTGLSILINDGKQALLFDNDSQEYGIFPSKRWKKYIYEVRCKLVEIKAYDLQIGDFYLDDKSDIFLCIDKGESISIDTPHHHFYTDYYYKVKKIVPILD